MVKSTGLLSEKSIMTIINSYEEFKSIQKGFPRSISNDYLMPDEIKKHISFGELSYSAEENALFMLIKRESLSKLVYRLRDFSAKLPALNEPVATYIIYREASPRLRTG